MKIILILTILVFLPIYSNELRPITKDKALQLAVKLSNDECKKQFDVSPFDTSSFKLKFENNYWTWGALDVSGVNGYSVATIFDKYGKNDTVKVFFHVDYANRPYAPE